MDPPPVPPSLAALSTSAAPVANPTPTQPPVPNHPPYAEMITAAISALKERDGSSKKAIAKYIESNYTDLPPTQSALLSHHLKRLKANGQLLMVKHSYKLPRSANVASNGATSAVSSDPDSTLQKRRPGRPPKPKPDQVQAAVPVFDPPLNMNSVPPVVLDFQPPPTIAAAPDNGPVTPARGRGRPRKLDSAKQGSGRPPRSVGVSAGSVGGASRPRGRPRKNVAPGTQAVQAGAVGRPRGRSRKTIGSIEGLAPEVPVGDGIAAAGANVGVLPVAGDAAVPVVGKRGRGRPPKIGGQPTGQPKMPRKLSGRPVGRPRKNLSITVAQNPKSPLLLVAYLDLKGKLEDLQSRVKQTANFIKPLLNSEGAINAIQELELLATDGNVAPPNAPIQQQQQQILSEEAQPQQPPFQI